ncbi:MAG TPA: helix-turn-helix domain-containing protein, partial [Anaerolineales bacterium]|nr:helix-turn-helix domain-containing protein [Anaerolineales bacterium]
PLFSRDFTEPELAVLRLTAAGVEPEEIARRLGASAHTVAGHTSNILAKLHLADRAEQALDAFKVGF